MNPGIDYGLGRTNIDTKTGIRFGVISQHTLGESWYESAEADYGDPTCPKCGNKACKARITDYHCKDCKYHFDSDEAYGDEPLGFTLDDGTYKAVDCLDSDVMLLKSPYYTYASFCSPCVPGAGNLDSAIDIEDTSVLQEGIDGAKTYAFGHDWFEDGKAPYVVYSVEDDSIIEPTQ